MKPQVFITVVDWKTNDVFLSLDKGSYFPGDEVILNINLVRFDQELFEHGTKMITADLLDGQVIHVSAKTTLGDGGKGKISFKLPTNICAPVRLLISYDQGALITFDFPLKKKEKIRFEAIVDVPTKIETGKEINLRFSFPEQADEAGKLVGWLVDRRIKKHPDAECYLQWDVRFYTNPIFKKVITQAFSKITLWSEIQKESVGFQITMSTLDWRGWAFKDTQNEATILVLNLTHHPSIAAEAFLKTLLSPSVSVEVKTNVQLFASASIVFSNLSIMYINNPRISYNILTTH